MKKLEQYTKGRKSYERQHGETDKNWAAFVMYRDQSPFDRSIRNAVKQYREQSETLSSDFKTTERNIQRVASNMRWVDRTEAWDRQMDTHKRRQSLIEIEKMKARHISLAQNTQGLAAIELRKFIDRANATGGTTVSLSDLLKAVELAVKLERNTRDMPETIIEDRVTSGDKDPRASMRPILNDPTMMAHVDTLLQRIESAKGPPINVTPVPPALPPHEPEDSP